ncbi:hypothetical protein [Streptomyces sp. ST2-7A]|uniref:hypothetical protein n=1 Tax=Streptomyces sp. ST2-7A TaxID=2907214 RepID=UPI001F16FC35|nr:hypothetical protein [Streptomyces sp. ST2-7A]MCE7080857.1 hypothetical protein [Streptomyces sp. ST2-7A]
MFVPAPRRSPENTARGVDPGIAPVGGRRVPPVRRPAAGPVTRLGVRAAQWKRRAVLRLAVRGIDWPPPSIHGVRQSRRVRVGVIA